MSISILRRHVEDLAAAHEIFVVIQSGRWWAGAIREADGNDRNEVHTPPIRSDVAYATALHEIGHILGRYQSSRRRVVREQWAWHWARDNALVWTPAMERSACASMASYEKKYAKLRDDPERDRCLD